MKKKKRIVAFIIIVMVLSINHRIVNAVTVNTSKPLTPTKLKATSAGYDRVKLSWDLVKEASGYQISRATSKTGTFKSIKTTVATSYLNTGITCGRTYYYKVRAYKYVGTKKVYGRFTTVHSAKPVPLTPTNFKSVLDNDNTAKLSWNIVKGASGYQISRATSKTGTFKSIKTTVATSYLNTGITCGRTYYYKVSAYKYVGTKKVYGRFTTVYSVKPVPLTPTNFKAVLANDNTAKLSWNKVKGASGYQLSRATSKTGTFKSIKTTGNTSYLDTDITGGRTFYYKVRAYKYVGNRKIYGKFTKITSVNTTKIVGYYAAWATYSGFTPDNLDVSKLTHINYAFANIGSDLKIALCYPDVDISNFNKLKELKKSYPNLKTIISVGGWSWSGRFSDVALTDSSRTTFADSCVDFIVQNGFDGVDIDWEYPVNGGLPTNKNRPADKTNFTLLMKKLREKLDARGEIDGKHYILTYAGASSNGYLYNTEISRLSQYVDYANIMTYDIHGTWDSYTDFNAPLYSNYDISPQYKWSIDQSINSWMKMGFPNDKMVMGVPFYGYVYKAVSDTKSGLYQSYSGGSSISYENIVGNYLNKPEYIRHFHLDSKVPWLFDGSTFISYDDEQSIELKAEYIKAKGLGGGMIWELSQDPRGILLRSFYNGLK